MEKFPGKKKLQEEKENVPTLLRSWVDERPEDADEIINQVQNPETKLENTVS